MKLILLDRKSDRWYLAKAKLWDYLTFIDGEKFNFDIQRSIVANSFLDGLYTTINKDEAIPPITLCSFMADASSDGYITLEDFSILDGLQRTYRLWLYKKIIELSRKYDGNWKQTINELNEVPEYSRGFYTVNRIKSIIEKAEEIERDFKSYDVYFYIWQNLSQSELIKLMLTLNVGAKRVSRTHQYELIFLNVYNQGSSLSNDISLIRSKNPQYSKVRNGDRTVGELPFPSVMIGFQSLIAGRPLRIDTSDFDLENIEDDSLISADCVEDMFQEHNLKIYLSGLYELDKIFTAKGDKYKKWFVKDTTIAGIMGSIGAKMKAEGNILDHWFSLLGNKIDEKGMDPYCLDGFDYHYRSLPTSRINIGKVIRNAVYFYTLGLIDGEILTWNDAFNRSLPKNQNL
ncbi:MAG: hypothetical protein HDS89_08555 [Bacteroidales bacterium]|nr:hypothetical protein [Bacteroidales bacterium]